MFRSSSTTLVKRQCRRDKVRWFGMNSDGTLAFGLRYYNSHECVTIYRATIFGTVHEIANIEFPGSAAAYKPIFNDHRHEIYWLQLVEFLRYSHVVHALVIFNVITGELQRYYCTDDEKLDSGQLIKAVDDVMIYFSTTTGNRVELFKIDLNPVKESFSLCPLAEIVVNNLMMQNLVIYGHFKRSMLYTGDELIVFYYDIMCKYLFSCDLSSSRWHMQNVLLECETSGYKVGMPSYGGHYFFNLHSMEHEICIIELDAEKFTWKLAFADSAIYTVPRESRGSWLVSNDSAIAFSIWQPAGTIEACMKVRVTVHCVKFLPLKYLCLRELLRVLHRLLPMLNDHEILDLSGLSSLVDVDKYFGKRFK